MLDFVSAAMDHSWSFNSDSHEMLRPAARAPFPSPKYTERYICTALTCASHKCMGCAFSPPDENGDIVAAPPRWITLDGRPVSPPPGWEAPEGWEPWTAEEMEATKAAFRSAFAQASTPSSSSQSSLSSTSTKKSGRSFTDPSSLAPSTGPSSSDDTPPQEHRTKTVNDESVIEEVAVEEEVIEEGVIEERAIGEQVIDEEAES